MWSHTPPLFLHDTRVCVVVRVWNYTIQAVDSDIWMCWLSFGRQRTGDVYAAEKDDLMIDQLLMLPPVLSLFTSPALSPSFVLLYSTPHPRYLVLSLTLFNIINIAHMATYCPLAAVAAIKRCTWLHFFFFNESGLCLPCFHFAGSGGIWLRALLELGSSWLSSVTSAVIMYSNVFEFHLNFQLSCHPEHVDEKCPPLESTPPCASVISGEKVKGS